MASALLPITTTSSSFSPLLPISSPRRLPSSTLLHLHRRSPPLPLRLRFPFLPSATTPEDNASEAGATPEEEEEEEEQPSSSSSSSSTASSVDEVEEIKTRLAEARAEGGFLGGVAEEVGAIEWPPFGKVVGTTGVVLSVIFGSSVALLTVNAILSELSDRVFAGRGVQDFFS